MKALSALFKYGDEGFLKFAARSLKQERTRQTLFLYAAEITFMALTFGTGIINSRWLGKQEYGVYYFVVTVVDVVMIFSGLGYPQSGARVVALAKTPRQEQAIQGSLVAVALLIGLAMSVVLVLLTPLIEQIFRTGQQQSLELASWLCVTAPLQLIMLQACRGANKILPLIGLKILPKALYLIGAVITLFFVKLNAHAALALYFGGGIIACIAAMINLRIRFDDVRLHIAEVTAEVKRYGFHSFLGGIADNSTFKLNNLLIAGYVDTTWLGYYGIAATMVSPMVTFSTSLSTSVYRSLTNKDRLDKRIFVVNTSFLVVCGGLIALLARPVINHVLTPEFLPVADLVYILVFTAFFQGMYQPINAFLGAHGKGKESRNISFLVCCVNLSVAFLLLPKLGAFGAALGSAAAKMSEMLGNFYYYRKITKSLQQPQAQGVPAT